jgi:hypothetical protein
MHSTRKCRRQVHVPFPPRRSLAASAPPWRTSPLRAPPVDRITDCNCSLGTCHLLHHISLPLAHTCALTLTHTTHSHPTIPHLQPIFNATPAPDVTHVAARAERAEQQDADQVSPLGMNCDFNWPDVATCRRIRADMMIECVPSPARRSSSTLKPITRYKLACTNNNNSSSINGLS